MIRRWHWQLVLGVGLCGCSGETPSETPRGGASSGGVGSSAGAGGSSSSGTGTLGGAGATSGGGYLSSVGGSAGSATVGCDAPGLTWKTARKTWYTSYPDPNSEECVEYNGCMWAGMFAACNDKKSEAWVAAHDIVAAFPNFEALKLHDLCLKSGDEKIVVTVLDTCADADCSGCCTQNQADNDALIDLESYTNQRWGVADGTIEWADLGPTSGGGCE